MDRKKIYRCKNLFHYHVYTNFAANFTNMKQIKFSSLCIAALAIVAMSCKKDSKKSNTELMSQSAWKLVKAEVKSGAATTWSDITSTYVSCEKDNNYIFRSNGTFEFNEGATKCSPGDLQIYDTGNWGFADGETKLFTQSTGLSASDTVSIELLSDGSFIFQQVDGSSTYRNTMGH